LIPAAVSLLGLIATLAWAKRTETKPPPAPTPT